LSGTVKRIVLILLAAGLILLFAIPALRRMEPQRDVVPPVGDTTQAAAPERARESAVRDEQEGKPPTPAEPEWRVVQSWNGTGIKTTDPFQISVNTWRVNWQTEIVEQLGVGAFQIQVFEGGALRSIAANTTKTDKGTTTLPGPGTYHLQINTLQKWSVKVEEKH
jgi:hypothetical protein